MRHFLYILTGLVIFLAGCTSRPAQPAPPNLLFVFADQFRKQAVGFMEEDPVVTPALDQLAREGVAFTNAVSEDEDDVMKRLDVELHSWLGRMHDPFDLE